MFQRKPLLKSSPNNSLKRGYLGSRILIWNALKQPNKYHRYLDFDKSEISSQSRNNLLKLLKSKNNNTLYRLGILEYELPDVKVWLTTKAKIENASSDHDKINILKEALDNGMELSAEDTPLLLSIANGRQLTKILQFFFDHNSCTTQHLVYFYNNCCTHYNLFTLCMNHTKFPKTHKDYSYHAANSIMHFYSNISNINTRLNVITFFLKNYPQLISHSELKALHQALISSYRVIKNITHNKNDLSRLKDTILLACHHPECSFLYSEKDINEFTLKNENGVDTHDVYYPLFWAAKIGYQDIFSLYYFHTDTLDYAREMAMKFSIERGNHQLITCIIDELVLSCHKETTCAFYLAITCQQHLVNDVLKQIINLVLDSAKTECKTALYKNHKLPEFYASKNHFSLSLFQKQSVSLDWIIERLNTGISNYVFSDRFVHAKQLSWCVDHLLKNPNLPLNCKLLIACSVTNEKFNVSKQLQFYVKQAIHEYTSLIEKIAEEYAIKLNFDFILFCQNFIAMASKGRLDPQNCTNINEHELIKQIIGIDLLDKPSHAFPYHWNTRSDM